MDNYEDHTFDFIYIDAVHLHDAVLWDLENYGPKIKNEGFIGGHDYIPMFPGVISAVDLFCQKHGFVMKALNVQGGDFLLAKK